MVDTDTRYTPWSFRELCDLGDAECVALANRILHNRDLLDMLPEWVERDLGHRLVRGVRIALGEVYNYESDLHHAEMRLMRMGLVGDSNEGPSTGRGRAKRRNHRRKQAITTSEAPKQPQKMTKAERKALATK